MDNKHGKHTVAFFVSISVLKLFATLKLLQNTNSKKLKEKNNATCLDANDRNEL